MIGDGFEVWPPRAFESIVVEQGHHFLSSQEPIEAEAVIAANTKEETESPESHEIVKEATTPPIDMTKLPVSVSAALVDWHHNGNAPRETLKPVNQLRVWREVSATVSVVNAIRQE